MASELMRLREAVKNLATEVIEKEGAFGRTLGTVSWDAGDCEGDKAFPKGRRLEDLSLDELSGTIEAVAEYLQEQRRQETHQYLSSLTDEQRHRLIHRFDSWICPHCGGMRREPGAECYCLRDD